MARLISAPWCCRWLRRLRRCPCAAQQRYAEQWQLWAADLGYDHLELRDSRSGLLARDALVGAGMIVLNESSSP